MEYNGVEVAIPNLQKFHIMFMEHQYELWKFRLERLVLKREDNLTASEIERVNKEQLPTVENLGKIYNFAPGSIIPSILEDPIFVFILDFIQ